MSQRAQRTCGRTPDPASVDRRVLVATEAVQIRDNRCARTDPAISPPTDPLPYFEIVFPLAGLWVRTVGGRDLAVEPNTIHFFSEGEVHRVHHPAGCGDRNTGIAVAPDVLDEIASLDAGGAFDRKRCVFRIQSRPGRDAELAAHVMLCRALFDPTVESLAVEEASLRLIAAMIANAGTAAPPISKRPHTDLAHRNLVLRVAQVLERRYSHSLTLSQIAREAATSPYHMARVFRARTGRSVHGHLRRLRIAVAAQYLLDSDLTLSVIADRVGFADAPHLCRTFRRVLGNNAQALRTLKWREALSRVDKHAGLPA